MENDKVADFISKVRQSASAYRNMVADIQSLSDQWGALYSTLVDEDSFTGENTSVIPSGDPATRTESITTVVSNFNTIISAYDAGQDTNFERVTI